VILQLFIKGGNRLCQIRENISRDIWGYATRAALHLDMFI